MMRDFPLWDLAPDSRSISRTFVAKNFAEGIVLKSTVVNEFRGSNRPIAKIYYVSQSSPRVLLQALSIVQL